MAGPVCVLSPHLLVAQAVAAALRSAGMAAETRTWESAVARGRLTVAGEERPEILVVIVDGLDNPSLVLQVDRLVQRGGVRVVVVTSAESAVRWGGLLANEAVDLVTVTTSVAELAAVVRRLAAGGTSMDPERRAALQTSWALDLDRRRQLRAQLESLSPQQRRVLELLASGHRVAEVGKEMGVAHGTVRSHVKALRAKLGASTQLKAVAMFHQAYDVADGADLVPSPRRESEGSVAVARR
ncbi:DNA-binding NarL/FixJ family response regulator [Nocardioides cavernae]|uniref:DNA-binding NarL/FixJ family response regulator n=1 Tax=Nocardioides cavernae TaxID=1921566 RepID=A0A7Y9H061_9ACTN|nr:LuxR C-terminal-related transcriptional regulator [Nocardioides cavernae]NYE35507.1 DNA-binding NarL/FixJ family response regulator [Nocardioides cavernae]